MSNRCQADTSGSLFRVRDARKAAQDNWRSGGHPGQVALAGQPLLQQPSHLRRLHHQQPVGGHGGPLRAQVRLFSKSKMTT